MRDYFIVAPPPTPNGDLHVGHLAGPYFGADIFRRYLLLRGHNVRTALSVDLNQSYVVTTAQLQGREPLDLAHECHGQIGETLSQAGIEFDVLGMPDAGYESSVSNWFRDLDAADVFIKRKRRYAYDVNRQRFMFESYASGVCAVCLSGTNGNICEACGHPNDAADLLGLYPTGGAPGDPTEMREISEYALELEDYRPELEEFLFNTIPERRPTLLRLLKEMFAKPLPCFPITFPSNWGIPAPFSEADGLVLNVWAEILPGHYYWLEQACRDDGVTFCDDVDYVQYLGFDNSFFYVIAQVALALAAKANGLKAVLPVAFATNEFYQLENFKFSTSVGHLIWGRELLKEFPSDDARFYLAWSNPEYSQSNFTRDDMTTVLDKKLRQPMTQLRAELAGVSLPPIAKPCRWSTAILDRFDDAYKIECQSLRMVAQTVANGLSVCLNLLSRKSTNDELASTLRAVAIGLAPLSPGYANDLWGMSGAEGPITWPHDTS